MKFKIKKNRHYHSNWWYHLKWFMAKNKSKMKFKLDESAWFEFRNNDSNDLNKIHGIRGWKQFKKGSEAFIGFVPVFDKKLEFVIRFQVRTSGKLWHSPVILTAKAGKEYFSKVEVTNYQYGWKKLNKPHKKNWIAGYHFMLDYVDYFVFHPNPEGQTQIQPHFGGNNKAPHTIIVELNKI